MKFLQNLPRFAFFTGKGGVGKTSLACATAVRLADAGKRVLLVSTDPASNVGQVFGQAIGNEITALQGLHGLWAMEIDPHAAAQGYRDRIVEPARAILPAEELRAMEEQLSGACTTEIAAFDEFTGLLTDASLMTRFDHVLFDTAPTGHTLRLLQLPGAWNEFLRSGKGDASCLGPLAGLDKQREQYQAAVTALADPARTRLLLVARAQPSSLREVARTHEELARVGLSEQRLVINGMLPAAEAAHDALAAAVLRREQAAVQAMPTVLKNLPRDELPLQAFDLVGLEALRRFFDQESQPSPSPSPQASSPLQAPHLADLLDEIALPGHGLILVMGKGGVGKTTLAAALAVALAERGLPVHLSTSDPAAHLLETLDGTLDQLSISRIEPHAETERYRAQVVATKGKKLNATGLALLEEDLRSPCTEEIAVFPGLLPHHPRGGPKICGDGHSTHRPHAFALGRHRRLSPRNRAPDAGHRAALHHAHDAAAGPSKDEGIDHHPGRTDAGAGGRPAADRSAPSRYRALGLGDQ